MDPASNPNLNGSGVLWSVYHKKRCTCHREQLILHFYPVVERVAAKLWRKTPYQVELADLVSIGTVGLITAVEGFDPCQGTPFEPYAAAKVRSVILDEARSRDWAPRSLRRRQREIDKAVEELRGQLLREPSHEEIAEFLRLESDETWTAEAVRETYLATEASYPTSLDEPLQKSDGEVISRYDLVPDPKPEPDTSSRQTFAQGHVLEFFQELPPQEAFVAVLYFYEELPIRDVAEIMGMPEAGASRVLTSVVMKLRELLLATV